MSESIVDKIRSWLAPLNTQIVNHPYILNAEKGALSVDKVKAFAVNQYYIIAHDARSLALMVSRSTSSDEFAFFNSILKGDAESVPLLIKLAEAVGLASVNLDDAMPIPKAVAYAHYLATLAHFASPAEQAMALIVNLPVWGLNCIKLSKALRTNYGIKETAFLDLFAEPMKELDEPAASIIDRYRFEEERLKRVARLIQAYELLFWNGIYQ